MKNCATSFAETTERYSASAFFSFSARSENKDFRALSAEKRGEKRGGAAGGGKREEDGEDDGQSQVAEKAQNKKNEKEKVKKTCEISALFFIYFS